MRIRKLSIAIVALLGVAVLLFGVGCGGGRNAVLSTGSDSATDPTDTTDTQGTTQAGDQSTAIDGVYSFVIVTWERGDHDWSQVAQLDRVPIIVPGTQFELKVIENSVGPASLGIIPIKAVNPSTIKFFKNGSPYEPVHDPTFLTPDLDPFYRVDDHDQTAVYNIVGILPIANKCYAVRATFQLLN